MDGTKIEWTDATWNPVRGCSRVSSGCDSCYAIRQARRFDVPGGEYEGLTRVGKRGVDWSGVVRLVPSMLDAPLRWKKPRRVFVNSMSDLFHEALSNEDIAAVFGVMAKAYWHVYQVLTKRPARMREWFAWAAGGRHVYEEAQKHTWPGWAMDDVNAGNCPDGWPRRNIWLGVSVEDQATADARIPELLATPAAVRWISLEPQLAGVDLTRYLTGTPSLSWVVQGGESGPNARPFDLSWARQTIAACKEAQAPCFVKQLSGRPYMANANEWDWPGGVRLVHDGEHCASARAVLRDRKGGDPHEWPSDLRVREMPR